ncbi:SMP-30/gluconolactonase/LRE family protein [Rhodococcus globerulus]|uniref:SMP-30/gluconolactonase/LRE family protein n=1 Tax=Rhodococcus globerulus TaxID=33008 RepID=UPI000A6357D8|nr:SMP-30/gluconolactonase/LRE family protein [Rhodococcus globerulus]
MRTRIFDRGIRVGITGALVAGSLLALGVSGAAAAPPCPGSSPAILSAQIPGAALEGVTVDGQGRLYATDLVSGRIFRVDTPGAAAVPIATVPGGAGALAWSPDGSLLVGTGANAGVLIGDLTRAASVARVDVNSGVVTPIAGGLSAANGLAVAHDGTIYATNDFGSLIGKVSPNGAVDPVWASLPSANGAALSADNRWLYVSRTFANPGVSRISVDNPGYSESLVNLGGLEIFSAPDGLTLDSHDRAIVPTDISGEVWRIDGPGPYCALTSELQASSVLTYGRGNSGFAAGHLYRAGFDGKIYEIPAGFDAGAQAATP